MHLVHVLDATRRLAAERTEEPGWRELHERTSRILEAIGSIGSGEPLEATFAGMDRINREVIRLDEESAELLAASLTALEDRPDGDQVEHANRTLRSMESDLT